MTKEYLYKKWLIIRPYLKMAKRYKLHFFILGFLIGAFLIKLK